MTKVFITGGMGFIGSHFVRFLLNKFPEWHIINFDKLTYAGNLDNLKDIEHYKNYEFIRGDVCNLGLLMHLLKDVDYIFHFAAESHVDNSIGNSLTFTMTDCYGTHVLMEAARLNNVKKILHVSTDEVMGDRPTGIFKEDDKLEPNNPYSASKAAAEMILNAYKMTYHLPVIIVRGNNVYGPCQHTEKLIPMCITKVLEGKKITMHGDGSYMRSFIYVEDFCESIWTAFDKGKIGEIYNLGTHDERKNIDVAKMVLKELGKDESFIEFVKDRPFNDRRYYSDLTKIKKRGWKQKVDFETGLKETIQWYKDNENWWKKVNERREANRQAEIQNN